MPKIPNLLAFAKHCHNCGKWMQRRALRKDVVCNLCNGKIFARNCKQMQLCSRCVECNNIILDNFNYCECCGLETNRQLRITKARALSNLFPKNQAAPDSSVKSLAASTIQPDKSPDLFDDFQVDNEELSLVTDNVSSDIENNLTQLQESLLTNVSLEEEKKENILNGWQTTEEADSSIRGALCITTSFFVSIGTLIMYFLGMLVDWRNAALICTIAPIASMIMVTFAPETPVWLLTRSRDKEALKSLCQLRGWTTPDNVKAEFDEINTYSKKMLKCVICFNTNSEQKTCEHESMNWFIRRILTFRHVMLCKETLRPLSLVIMYFLFVVMSGLIPIRPNLINVCGALGMAQDGKHIALMVSVFTFITAFVVIGLIKVVGKRKLAISSMLGSAVSCLLLSIYAKENLDDTVFSYNPSTFPTETNVVPVILLYLLTIFTAMGVPWVLLGELFPFRSRASAQGFAAASSYFFSFIATKTFIDLENNFMLWGSFAVYAGFGFFGTIFLYLFLPETEGKTLQEIEEFYKGELRIFANDPIINSVRKLRR